MRSHIKVFLGIIFAKSETDHVGPLGDLMWNDPHIIYCEVPNSCAVRNNSVGWKIHPN